MSLAAAYRYVDRYARGLSGGAAPRHARSVVSAIAGLALFLGPATGTLHTLHLTHAGEHHHSDSCAFCQQIISASSYLPDAPPVVVGAIDNSRLHWAIPSTDFPRIHIPKPLLPRAPPAHAAC